MLDYHIKYIIIVSTYIHTNYAGRAVRVYLKYLTNLDWERFVLHLEINKLVVAVVFRYTVYFWVVHTNVSLSRDLYLKNHNMIGWKLYMMCFYCRCKTPNYHKLSASKKMAYAMQWRYWRRQTKGRARFIESLNLIGFVCSWKFMFFNKCIFWLLRLRSLIFSQFKRAGEQMPEMKSQIHSSHSISENLR